MGSTSSYITRCSRTVTGFVDAILIALEEQNFMVPIGRAFRHNQHDLFEAIKSGYCYFDSSHENGLVYLAEGFCVEMPHDEIETLQFHQEFTESCQWLEH